VGGVSEVVERDNPQHHAVVDCNFPMVCFAALRTPYTAASVSQMAMHLLRQLARIWIEG